MADFKIAYDITSEIEGGYVNHPNDRGGETYAGIARKFWGNWEGWKIIDEYKKKFSLKTNQKINDPKLKELVKDFYKEQFWDKNRLSEVMDQPISNELYDSGVNFGTVIAARFLQQSLNLLNRNQKDFKDIKEDGVIGPITLNLLNSYKHPKAILITLNVLQGERYLNICRRDPSQEEFFRGWLNRVSLL